MTPVAWVLVALFATLAVSDWWATRAKRLHYRYFSKPATLLALIALASALQPADPGIRAVMVVGLALSLAGDVFLLFEERAFVAGLLSFLLAHIAYTVARQMAHTSWAWAFVGLLVVGGGAVVVGRRILAAVRAGDSSALALPVAAYLLVISVMVVSAFGTGAVLAIVGASLFYLSDAILAWDRFVTTLNHGPVVVMVT